MVPERHQQRGEEKRTGPQVIPLCRKIATPQINRCIPSKEIEELLDKLIHQKRGME